jgi:ACS family pantothenate transporter-like MFS transporter
MTVPVGFITWWVLPDTPYTTRAWFLSDEDKQLAIDRAKKAGKAAPAKVTLATFKRVLTGWRWYAFVLGYVLYGSACGASDYFGIWLKSEGFSVVDRNIIPTGTKLISGFCIVLWGFLSDYTGSRFAFVFGPLAYGLIPNGILAFWPPSQNAKLFAFLTCGVQLMTAIFYTWANEICAGDNEERAIVISSMNGFQYAVAAWLPIVIFPQTMAPTFRYGFPGTFGLVIAALIAIVAIQILHTRSSKRNGSPESQEGDEESDVSDEYTADSKGVSKATKTREVDASI